MNAAERGANIARAIEQTTTGEMSIEGGLLLASNLIRPGKVKTAVAWTSVGYTVGRRLWKLYKSRQKGEQYYQIRIDESDDLYDEVCSWFMEQIPEEEQYSVEAETLYLRIKGDKKIDASDPLADMMASVDNYNPNDEDDDGGVPSVLDPSKRDRYEYQIKLSYNEKRSKPLFIDGYEIKVQHVIPGYNTEDSDDSDDGMPDPAAKKRTDYSSSRYVLINCPSYEARQAVINKLNDALDEPEFIDKQPSFYQATSYGEWRSQREIPLRKLESVILKPGQIETIVADIQRFLGAEERYVELGIPYHRGILLHGSPGTGKTSIAAAIANHLKLDVYYVSLSSIKDNQALKGLLDSVRPRSVLLLEEVDTCAATTEGGRDKESTIGITMDVLLQCLDGMSTPHGLITVMTTNRLHVLDDAMIRPGRADLKLEITAVNTEQVRGICRHYLGYVPEGLPEVDTEVHGITPADVIEIFKQNIYDTKQAGRDLVDYLNAKVAAASVRTVEEIGSF